MQPSEIITVTGIIGIFGLVWKANKDSDSKVSRLYSRLDEIKQDNEIKFTRKDVCELQHKQVNDNFDRVKETLGEMKSDIKEIKNILNNGHKQ